MKEEKPLIQEWDFEFQIHIFLEQVNFIDLFGLLTKRHPSIIVIHLVEQDTNVKGMDIELPFIFDLDGLFFDFDGKFNILVLFFLAGVFRNGPLV